VRHILFLAWRYLAYHPVTTAILVGAVTLIAYLPMGLNILIARGADDLTSRAESTPLILGAKGSPLELVLRTLYFESAIPEGVPFGETGRDELLELARAVPIDARFRTRFSPIVGTTIDYFEFRNLRVASGRWFAMLGECVLGSEAARIAEAGPGDAILSASESVFDLAGVYPLRMRVAGVLEPSGTPDDRAVFVDIKTAWVIAGWAHGHAPLDGAASAETILRRDDREITANAAVAQYNEVTPGNVGQFHFHGDQNTFPVTAILVVPTDGKAATILEGRYVGADRPIQMVRPQVVIGELIGTVFTVRRYVVMALTVVGGATGLTMALVFALSWQLRRREFETIGKIGGTRRRIGLLAAAEILGVVIAGAVLAGLLVALTDGIAGWAARWLVRLA